MKRFLLKTPPGRDGLVRLSGDDYRYLAGVRRYKKGDVVSALNGTIPGTLTVLSTSGRALSAVFMADASPEAGIRADLPPIILFQAMPKGTKADTIIRQAAEGELSEVLVFVSEHSAVKTDAAGRREERWRRIVREARQQSGSAVETRPVFLSFDAALAYWNTLRNTRNALGILLHPGYTLEQTTFHDYLDTKCGLVALAAGPEGGFSGAEIRRFLDAGFRTVNMGGSVLRAETAALYGAAAVRIILLEKTAWTLKKTN